MSSDLRRRLARDARRNLAAALLVVVTTTAVAPGPVVGGAAAATSALPSATTATSIGPSDPGSITSDARVSPTGLRREVFGFLPYWELSSSSLRLDYRKLSTIAYFGIGVDGAGNLQRRNADGSTTVGWRGWTSPRMTRIIAAAHANHTRVVLTVQSFAWNVSGLAQQRTLLASAAARANLARQIAAAVRGRGADGVNLDFEPLAFGSEAGFTALIRRIRVELDRVHRGAQITFDTTGRIGNYPVADATARGGADAVFVMAYDYRTAGSSPVGSVAPLDRADGADVRDTILSYLDRVPASKIILGVPYYGRAWSTPSSALNAANTSSARTGPSTSVPYSTAVEYLARYGRHYDPTEGVAWTAYRRQTCAAASGCVTSWRQLYVDDASTIRQKYDLVNLYNLRGAGIWALGFDGTRPELWRAIQAKFIDDTTPPIVGIVTLPARVANPAFLVRWTGYDDVGITRYDVQVATDGRPWSAWLTRTSATSAMFAGADGHRYAFRVRAHDRAGNVSAWNVTSSAAVAPAALARGGFATVVGDGLAVRSAPSATATRIGDLAAGDLLAVLAGPRAVGGYRWVQVTGPLPSWRTIRPVIRSGWVAVSGGGRTFVVPAKAPNATTVVAAIKAVTWNGGGTASLGIGAGPVAERTFSPNGDGARDTMRLDWRNAISFDRLVLRIFRANGVRVGDVPLGTRAAGRQTAFWNGAVGGVRVPNGRYLAVLVGTAGGRTYFASTSTFRSDVFLSNALTIDTAPPTVVSAGVSRALLSPNGDGIADSVTVGVATRGGTAWAAGVAPVTRTGLGAPILVRTGSGGSVHFTWTGRTTSGAIAADGIYRMQVIVRDDAGNRAIRTWTVRVDRTPPTLTLAAPATFSPNADGAADTARLGWIANESVTGTARIVRPTGSVVRSWTIGGTSGALAWDGRSAGGSPAADGRYLFQIVGRDAAGNATLTRLPIVVDRTLSTLRWSRSSFDPGASAAAARTVKLTFILSRPATVTLTIDAGTAVVRRIMTGVKLAAGSHSWVWDGRNASGAVVPAGTYVAVVRAGSSVGASTLTRAVTRIRAA